MIKNIELNGKSMKIEFILPDEIREFLKKNEIDENQLLEDYKWDQCIDESLLDEDYKIKNDFDNLKLIINYIHITQENQIRVKPENFTKGKFICSSDLTKGTFSKDFSIGYSIFDE